MLDAYPEDLLTSEAKYLSPSYDNEEPLISELVTSKVNNEGWNHLLVSAEENTCVNENKGTECGRKKVNSVCQMS